MENKNSINSNKLIILYAYAINKSKNTTEDKIKISADKFIKK